MAKAKSKAKAKKATIDPFDRLPEELRSFFFTEIESTLNSWIESKQVAPSILFTGPKGIGKQELTKELAQWLQCQKSPFYQASEDLFQTSLLGAAPADATKSAPPSKTPCGECPSCLRFQGNRAIDFLKIAPEILDTGKQGSIKIDDLEPIKKSLGFAPHDSPFRIFILSDAETLTLQAANSLLKILEEPPERWIFFLTASDPSLVLPTIVSRCLKVRLSPPGTAMLETVLVESGHTRERSKIAALLSDGSWKRAVELAKDETWERRASLLRFFQKPQTELNPLLEWSTKDPRNLELLLDQMEIFLADWISWSTDPEGHTWFNQDVRSTMQLVAQKAIQKQSTVDHARRFWLDRSEDVLRTRQRMSAPLNRKILIQDVLLPWIEGAR